jgi:hypothetical protein
MGLFNRRETSQLWFLPIVAAFAPATSTGSPTSGEFAAGIKLDALITGIDGMDVTPKYTDAPTLAHRITPKVIVGKEIGEPKLTFFEDDADFSIRLALASNADGYLIRLPYGKVTGKRCEVWPMRSGGPNDDWTIGDDLAKFTIGFSVSYAPNLAGVCP